MHPPSHRPLVSTLTYGIGSLFLYVLLLTNADLFVDWAERTRQGEVWLFLIPVAVAFLFSWVHGHFTSQFWELLGLHPAQGAKNKKQA